MNFISTTELNGLELGQDFCNPDKYFRGIIQSLQENYEIVALKWTRHASSSVSMSTL